MKIAFALTFALSLLTACEKKKEAPAAPAPAPAPAPASASAAPAAMPAPIVDQAPAAPVAGDGLKIPAPTYKVGDKETKAEDMTMKMKVEPKPGQQVEMDFLTQKTETREVLAVDGAGMMTKIKIAYTTIKDTQTMAGKSKDRPSLTSGKTYVVWTEGGAIKATREDGSAPATEELNDVLDDHRRLGKPDPMDVIVASKTWKTGEKVVLTAAELEMANNASPAKSDGTKEILEVMELTLTGVDAGVASFTMHMVMNVKGPKAEMKLDITGGVKVNAANGKLFEIGGSGPVTGNMGMPLTGDMTMKESTTY